jgi:hypothetical protein
MKELRRQMSELIFADKGPARIMRSAIVALAIAVSGPAVALTINLTYDPDSTFTAAGLSAADIANMKAAASYAASQLANNFTDSVNVNIRVTAVSGTKTLGAPATPPWCPFPVILRFEARSPPTQPQRMTRRFFPRAARCQQRIRSAQRTCIS